MVVRNASIGQMRLEDVPDGSASKDPGYFCTRGNAECRPIQPDDPLQSAPRSALVAGEELIACLFFVADEAHIRDVDPKEVEPSRLRPPSESRRDLVRVAALFLR